MTVLNEFTADEQLLLMEGPRLGAVVVSAASLGQKRETASEGFAAADYILNSRGDYLDNALVSSILYEIENALPAEPNLLISASWPAYRGPRMKRLPGYSSWPSCLTAR